MSLLSIPLFLNHSANAESGKDLVDGKLAVCPGSPNCISTENGELEPVSFDAINADEAWLVLQTTVKDLGGKIEKKSSNYLWATFKTPLIKFTDDVEARLDTDNKMIHLRSASRVGYYDFNANKNRLRDIKNRVSSKLNPARLTNTYE